MNCSNNILINFNCRRVKLQPFTLHTTFGNPARNSTACWRHLSEYAYNNNICYGSVWRCSNPRLNLSYYYILFITNGCLKMSCNDDGYAADTRRSSMGYDDYIFAEVVNKLPLKRFEVAIHKLTKVAIPLHLELLNQHKSNISKVHSDLLLFIFI